MNAAGHAPRRAIGSLPQGEGALALDTYQLGKHFGAFTALDDVTMSVQPGTVHALLGENGAGKSTLVKCVAGFQRPDTGSLLLDQREHDISSPAAARALGIGMVYQHFTLAPGMTVAENLLLAGGEVPSVIDWRMRREQLQAFLATTPFRLDLDARPSGLAAGEKQKLELLKQLYLRPRLLILDEPTSVLTPQEADEVLGHVREIAHSGACTVLLITHKFREVNAYADAVTVLRRGKGVYHGLVRSSPQPVLAAAMMGTEEASEAGARSSALPGDAEAREYLGSDQESNLENNESNTAPAVDGQALTATERIAYGKEPVLRVEALCAQGDRGTQALHGVSFVVRAGEILGVAGISGNGQRELVEALVGQRRRSAGKVWVRGEPYRARRADNRRLQVRSLPEEPLKNACVAGLSVAQNMALRDFDQPPLMRRTLGIGWLRPGAWKHRARRWIAEYGIKTRGENAAIGSLSGGNVQRAVLARELAGDISVLIAANPVFGLDFAAVRDIHSRIRQVRDSGAAVLLVSEDLDELLGLADRIVVMSEGRFVFETAARGADRRELGAHMGGGHGAATAATANKTATQTVAAAA